MKRIALSVFCSICFLSGFAQTDIETKYQNALELAENGSVELAIEIWNDILITKPQEYRALKNLIVAHTNQDDFRLAKRMIRRAQSSYPDSLGFYCQLADVHARKGEWRRAAKACMKSNHAHAMADALVYKSYAFPMILGFNRKHNELLHLASTGDETAIAYINDMHLVMWANPKNWGISPCGHVHELADFMSPYLDSSEDRKTILHEFISEFDFDPEVTYTGHLRGRGLTTIDYLVFNVAILCELTCTLPSNRTTTDHSSHELSVVLKRLDNLLASLDETDFQEGRQVAITKSEFLAYFEKIKMFLGENSALEN